MKKIKTYESSLRFCRTFYGVLALTSFLTRNLWISFVCAVIMIIGVVRPNRTNLVYQFHKRFLRPKFSPRAEPIPRPVGELRFACLFGGLTLVVCSTLVYFNVFTGVAWAFVLALSFLMILSGFSGVCAATLLYIFVIKKSFGFRDQKTEIFSNAEQGSPNYVNPNCWVARSIESPPWQRCRYCQIGFKSCPMFKFLLLIIFLGMASLLFSFMANRDIFWEASESLILALVFMSVAFGYLFNKNTLGLLEKERAAQKVLEVRVKARTRELQERAERREEVIEERTKELKQRVQELEKFRRLVVGRELKMKELKQELQKMKKELNE